jgi:hypothetical protein
MTQPEHELARKIVERLDHGTERLDPGTRERLAAARKVALSHYREKSEAVLGLVWAGQAMARLAEHHLHHTRLLAAAAAIAVLLAGFAYWQVTGPASNDLAEIDMGLLTDELPLNAYLDKGFDSWLKRSSR